MQLQPTNLARAGLLAVCVTAAHALAPAPDLERPSTVPGRILAMLSAPTVSAQEDADKLAAELHRALRTLRYAIDDPRKAAEAGAHLASCEDLLARLVAARPDHPKRGELEASLAQSRDKLAAVALKAIERDLEGDRRYVQRHLDDALKPRGGPADWAASQAALTKAKEPLDRMTKRLDESRAALASAPGQAFEAKARAGLAELSRAYAAAALRVEARQAVYAHDPALSFSLDGAIAAASRALDQADEDRAVTAFDAARKLARRLRGEAHLLEVDEAAEALARFAEVEARYKATFAGRGGDGDGDEGATAGLAALLPRVRIDYDADAEVQRLVRSIQESYRMFADDAARGEEVAKRIDLAAGNHDGQVVPILRDLDAALAALTTRIREGERDARAIVALAPESATAKAVLDATPALLVEAQSWKRRHAARAEAALAISRAASAFGFGESARARGSEGGAAGARHLVDALVQMDAAEQALAPAFELLPEADRAAAERWAERIGALRADAGAALVEVSVRDGRALALGGQKEKAEEIARILAEALPGRAEANDLVALIGGATEARHRTEEEICERRALIDVRAAKRANEARPDYERWKAAQPLAAAQGDPQRLLAELSAAEGKVVVFRKRWLTAGLHDGFDDLAGGVWYVAYDPALRDALLARAEEMDQLALAVAERVHGKHGVPFDLPERYLGRFGFEEVEVAAVVTGQRTYTPKREIKDATGRVVGTFEGTPYAVPAVRVVAVSAKRAVAFPGAGTSLDAFDASGLLP